MRTEHPTGEDTSDTPDSLYGSPRHEPTESSDEQTLYGSPRHEIPGGDDEKQLYGDPQHEIEGGDEQAFDLDIAFARSLANRLVGPETTVSTAEPRAHPTEQ